MTKTKMCKFNNGVPCSRGQACVFAHSFEELRPLPDLRLTKMCRTFKSHGFCEQADRCSFAHSEEELRRPAAQLQLTAKEQDDPLEEGRQSGEVGCPPKWQPSLCTDDFSQRLASIDLGQASEFEDIEVDKSVSASEDIFSRQTTAQATSMAWSRQTTALVEEVTEPFSHQTSDDFEFEAVGAINVITMEASLSWLGRIDSLAEGTGSISNSSSDDTSSVLSSCSGGQDLELQVCNTFLAALPRRRSARRASSTPARSVSVTKSAQSSRFFSL